MTTSAITPISRSGALAPERNDERSLAPHKRRPAAGPAFVIPGYACFACADTGIVSNFDRAINAFVSDYDVLPSGEIMPGSDPAIICCCMAAYPTSGFGYRDSSGPRRIETACGPRAIGCDLDPQAVQTIHRERRARALAGVKATAEHVRRLRLSTQEQVAGLLPSLENS
jgi:hypothetical protein